MNTIACTIAHAAPSRVRIAKGDVACIHDGRGARITVERGNVWITQHRSARDICLTAGESFRIARDGLTLATPIGHGACAVFRLERVAREGAAAGVNAGSVWRTLFARAPQEQLAPQPERARRRRSAPLAAGAIARRLPRSGPFAV